MSYISVTLDIPAGLQGHISSFKFPISMDFFKRMIWEIFSPYNIHYTQENMRNVFTSSLVDNYVYRGGLRNLLDRHPFSGRLITSPNASLSDEAMVQANLSRAPVTQKDKKITFWRSICSSIVCALVEEVVSDLNRLGASQRFNAQNPTIDQLAEHYYRSGGFQRFLIGRCCGSYFFPRLPL